MKLIIGKFSNFPVQQCILLESPRKSLDFNPKQFSNEKSNNFLTIAYTVCSTAVRGDSPLEKPHSDLIYNLIIAKRAENPFLILLSCPFFIAAICN